MLSTIGLMSLAGCFVILARVPPSRGYEISVYDAYPVFFWFFIALTIVSGFFILIDSTFFEYKSDLYLLGFLFILLSNFIILNFPILRGYAFYGRDDAISHLGFVKDILVTGHVGESNFYPLSHILVTTISIILNVEPSKIIVMVTPLFYLIYANGIFMLAQIIAKDLKQALLVVIFATPISIGIYSAEYYPIGLSIMLIPLILYFFFKKMKIPSFQFAIPFLIFIFASIFLHPLTCLLLIPIFVIYGLSVLICRHVKAYKKSALPEILNPTLIIFIAFVSWISSFKIFITRPTYLFDWFSSEFKYSYIRVYQTAIEKANPGTYEFIEVFLRMYGQSLIYLIFFIWAGSLVFKKIFLKRRSLHENEVFFALSTIFFGFIFIIFLFTGFDVLGHPFRLTPIITMNMAISNGLILFDKITKMMPKNKNFLVCLLALMIILSSFLGLFSTYSSPLIKTLGHAVSYTEFTGGEWLAKNGELTTKVIPVASQFGWRMREATLGFEIGSKGRSSLPPPHFGYDSNNSASSVFKEKVYIVITIFDIMYYTDLWPIQGSFYISDFEKLNNDLGVNLIYVNKGFTTYYVDES